MSVDTIPKACAECGDLTRRVRLGWVEEADNGGARWICADCRPSDDPETPRGR